MIPSRDFNCRDPTPNVVGRILLNIKLFFYHETVPCLRQCVIMFSRFLHRHTTIDRFDSARRPSRAAETVRDCTEQPAAAVRPSDPCACAPPSRHSAAPRDSVFRFRQPCRSSPSPSSFSLSVRARPVEQTSGPYELRLQRDRSRRQ